MRALIIDDCSLMQRQHVEALARLGIKDVKVCGDGMKSLELIASFQPHIALVDWNLPGVNGLSLVRAVRQTNKNMVILMITAESSRDKITAAGAAGVNGYIVKPCTAKGVAAQVKAVLMKKARKAGAVKPQASLATKGKQKGPRRAMLIDDCTLIHRQIENVLERIGFDEIRACVDGLAAIAELRTFEPELVLVDLNMPNLNGIETIRRIRAENKTMPLVMLTSERTGETIVQAEEAGATAYLTKPFTPQGLAAQLADILKKQSRAA